MAVKAERGEVQKRPVLHHVLGSWWVGEYPIRLLKERTEWRVLSQPSETEAGRWLEKSRLKDQRFKTRKDALEALMVALEMPGAVRPIGKLTCKKIGAGKYRLAGELIAERNRSNSRHIKWNIIKTEAGKEWGKTVGSAESLWRAAWIAERKHQEKAGPAVAIRGH